MYCGFTRSVNQKRGAALKEQQRHNFDVDIMAQPDDTTCGPTCLQAVYRYYGDQIALENVINEVHAFEGGGTLAVWLACHALKRGYEAKIYTYNMQVFDPTWFPHENDFLRQRLKEQIAHKQDPKLILATHAYLEFLELNGKIKLEDLTRDLLRRYLIQNIPILTGLSSSFLYRTPREFGPNSDLDDIRGEPSGHFVLLCGYDREKRTIRVADPFQRNPFSPTRQYEINIDRVICSILLGILTYDANFLIIQPKRISSGKTLF